MATIGKLLYAYVGQPTVTFTTPLSRMYPIYEGSNDKNDHAKIFNDCHMKSMELLKNITIYMEGAKKRRMADVLSLR